MAGSSFSILSLNVSARSKRLSTDAAREAGSEYRCDEHAGRNPKKPAAERPLSESRSADELPKLAPCLDKKISTR
jgi:hypothetical protein